MAFGTNRFSSIFILLKIRMCNFCQQSRVSTNGLRSVEHNGGLDNWLLKTKDEKLSARAIKVKRELKKAAKEAA